MSALHRLILPALLGAAVALPAGASSTSASASLEGSSASIGTLSGSVQASSQSVSGTVVAEGPYRVTEVALAGDASGRTRVTLAGVQGAPGFALLLPPAAAAQARLAVDDVVQVRARGYGLQFVRADATEPFFLALDDTRWRELQSRTVAL